MEPGSARRRLTTMRVLLVAAALLGMTACTSSDPPPAPPESDVDLQGQWRLVSARIDGEALELPPKGHFSLVISAGGDQAHAGCLVVMLRPEVDGKSVSLHETDRGYMRSCLPGTVQTPMDEPYMTAVTTADHAERADNTLTLTGPSGVLTFKPPSGRS